MRTSKDRTCQLNSQYAQKWTTYSIYLFSRGKEYITLSIDIELVYHKKLIKINICKNMTYIRGEYKQ